MPIKKPGEGFRGTEGRIGYLLRQASHAIRVKIDRSLRKYGITHPQFSVLSILELEPGLHVADIARASMFSPQAVNTIIANLETSGLVKRTPHEIHGRVIEIFLTDLGRKRLAQCKHVVYTLEEQMLKNMKPKEEKLIRSWLVRCASV